MTRKEITSRLTEISSDYNFIYIIAGSILKDFCSPIDYLEHRNPHDHFSYTEAAFLIGLWIKNSSITSRNQYNYEERFKETYNLMEQMHQSLISDTPNFLNKENITAADFMNNGASFKEAFFYSSTGAYDFQYASKFSEKYKYDEEWLKHNKGFSLSDPLEYFTHLKNLVNTKLNDPKIKGNKNITANDLLFPFMFTHSELTKNNKAFDSITLSFITELEKGNNMLLNIPGDFNEFQTKPIIKLDTDRYFIPMPFYLAEAIYESPFYWMTTDKSYSSICLKNRGIVGEEIVHVLFSKIFGVEKTFKGVLIKENKTKTVAEIDVCGRFESTLLAVQVKSKKLTSLSKQGDIDKIRDDFKKGVEDAFLQGIKCEKAILNREDLIFIDDIKSDLTEKFKGTKIVYSICLVLDNYPALTHSSHILLYDKYEDSTICFSIFDLEVICRYLNTPQRLLDYFIKRITNCRYYYAENELCFLGYYLEHDLKKIKESNAIMIDDSFASKIDRNYYAEISGYNDQIKKKKIGRNEMCPCGSGVKYKYCHGKS